MMRGFEVCAIATRAQRRLDVSTIIGSRPGGILRSDWHYGHTLL
jgi:hypothetical protein